jgi:hypothetical protein
MNRVVAILMKRDGISEAEATELVEDTKAELLDCTNCLDADDIIASNLGLEPDYIMDILE